MGTQADEDTGHASSGKQGYSRQRWGYTRPIPGERAGVRVGGDKLQMTYGQVVGEGLLQAACKPMKLTKGKAAFGKMKLAAGGRHWGRRKQG